MLERVAAAVAGAVPGLDAAGARLLVTEAASRRGALRQLDRHLAAFPGALASGSSDAPKAVIALAGLLSGAGYGGIGVAACLACGRPGELPHRSGDGRLCRNCYRRRRQEPCRRCGRTRPVHARTAAGPLCSTCSAALQPSRPCGACGQDGPVRAWRPDGSAVCRSCYRAPERPCARCGRLAVTYALLAEGPACGSCCGRPLRRCGGCGLDRPVRLRAAAGQPVMRPGPARHGVVAGGAPRGRILAALAFLAWLDDRGTTLGAATQADVDDWLHGASQQRYLLRDFLTWASARRLAGQVTVPALPRSELTGLITEDSRWQLLSRCLRDPGIPLDVRTAGALLLLYGQFVSRLTRVTAADIGQP